jgi:hypothetical protein
MYRMINPADAEEMKKSVRHSVKAPIRLERNGQALGKVTKHLGLKLAVEVSPKHTESQMKLM